MKPHLDDEVSLGSGLLSRNPQSAKSDKAQLEYFFKHPGASGNDVRTQLGTRVDCTLKHGWAAEKSGDAPIVTRNLGRSGRGRGSRYAGV